MPESVAGLVLDLARRRHIAISTGDFETYSELDDAMASECSRLLAIQPGGLSPTDIASLDELIALENASFQLLGDMTAEVSERLGELVARRRTNSAYLRSERSSVNPV